MSHRLAFSRAARGCAPALALLVILVLIPAARATAADLPRAKPRVIVTTDINILHGDPDDRQSWVHVLWNLDQLDLRVITADRSVEGPEIGALRACHLAVDAYARDFNDPTVHLRELGYPSPEEIRSRIKPGDLTGLQAIIDEARRDDPRPLYVLVWGHMIVLEHALYLAPDIAPRLRVISIATWNNLNRPNPRYGPNSAGRDDIFRDSRYRGLWWLEIETIRPMFAGLVYPERQGVAERPGETQRVPIGGEPFEFLNTLSHFGALGRHMVEVADGNPWARYFRAGDTPSVLYLLDPAGSPDDPSVPSWAGRFERPFPEKRPNHWTDASDGQLDHAHPERTADREADVAKRRFDEVLARRPAMYRAFLDKLERIYGPR